MSPAQWLDWRAPSSVLDRVRLEALRFSNEWKGREEYVDEWKNEALTRIASIDSERLVSLILRKKLETAPVVASELEPIEQADTYDAGRQPVSEAHRKVPPLFTSIAVGWLAHGDGDRAIHVINERLDRATQASSDRGSQRAAILAKLHSVRRMRMRNRAESLISNMASSDDPADAAIAWRVMAVSYASTANTIPRPGPDASMASIGGWWSAQQTLSYEAAVNAVTILKEVAPAAIEKAKQIDSSQDALSLYLSLKEAEMVAYRLRMSKELREMGTEFLDRPFENLRPLDELTEEEFRLILRARALDTAIKGIDDELWSLVKRWFFGRPRAFAEMLLEEGELMALRLPDKAISLLDEAERLFREAYDPVGATIAAIRSMVAAIHSGQSGPALLRYANIENNYSAVPSNDVGIGLLWWSQAGLPSWSELESLRSATVTANRTILDHPSWQGWLQRLVHLAVWQSYMIYDKKLPLLPEHLGLRQWLSLLVRRSYFRYFDRIARPAPFSDQWLKDIYGPQLPLELDLTITSTAEQITAAQKTQYRRDATIGLTIMVLSATALAGTAYDVATRGLTGNRLFIYLAVFIGVASLIASFAKLREWFRPSLLKAEGDASLQMAAPPTYVKRGLDLVMVAVALGIGATVLVGGYFLFGWLIGKASGSELSNGVQIPLYIALLAVAGIFPRLVKKVRDSMPRLRALDAELAARIEHFFTEKVWGPATPAGRPPNTILMLKVFGFLSTFAVSLGMLGVIQTEGRFGPASIGVLVAWILFTLLFLRQFYVAMRDEARSILAARGQVRLHIDAPRESRTSTRQSSGSKMQMSFEIWQRRIRARMGRLFTETPLKFVSEVSSENVAGEFASGSSPYIGLAAELPTPATLQMSELKKRLLRRKLPVALRVDSRLGYFPWEAVFNLALQQPHDEFLQDSLQFFRQGDPYPRSAPATDGVGTRRVNFVGSDATELMAKKGWEPLNSQVNISYNLAELLESEKTEVLHLVGVPLMTTAGFRLQIGRTRPTNVRQSSEATRRQEMRGDVLIAADALPMDGVSLVVVQNDPAEITARVDSEREQAGYLRAFAAEVFAAGAQTVIVLPKMAPAVAETALREVASRLQERFALELQPLLKTVSSVRNIIRGDTVPGSGSTDSITVTRLELAFDVCVFARQNYKST